MTLVPEGWVATFIFTYLHTTFYFPKFFTLIEDDGSHRFSAVLEIGFTDVKSVVYYNFKVLSLVLLSLKRNLTMQLLYVGTSLNTELIFKVKECFPFRTKGVSTQGETHS